MNTYVQLFDLESGKLIAEFNDEDEALGSLRPLAPDELHRLGLVRMDGEDVTLIATEDGLVRRVHGNVIAFTMSEPSKRKVQ